MLAEVSPPLPEPEFAPPAASTVPVVAEVLLLPCCATAVALPVVDVELPVLLTVLLLVIDCVAAEVLPVPSAAPVVVLPPPPLAMVVLALVPVALALPLLAVAVLLTELDTLWLFDALVLPLPVEPLAAPPAAFTAPVLAVVLLLPTWPVPLALPLLALAVPVFETLVVLVEVEVAPLLPPLVAPPVAVLPPELDETVVLLVVPVECTAPLDPVPEELLEEVELWVLEEVVSARAGVLTSSAITPAAALARRVRSTFFDFKTPGLADVPSLPESAFLDRATACFSFL